MQAKEFFFEEVKPYLGENNFGINEETIEKIQNLLMETEMEKSAVSLQPPNSSIVFCETIESKMHSLLVFQLKLDELRAFFTKYFRCMLN